MFSVVFNNETLITQIRDVAATCVHASERCADPTSTAAGSKRETTSTQFGFVFDNIGESRILLVVAYVRLSFYTRSRLPVVGINVSSTHFQDDNTDPSSL